MGGAVQYDAVQTPTVTRNNLSRKPLPGGALSQLSKLHAVLARWSPVVVRSGTKLWEPKRAVRES